MRMARNQEDYSAPPPLESRNSTRQRTNQDTEPKMKPGERTTPVSARGAPPPAPPLTARGHDHTSATPPTRAIPPHPARHSLSLLSSPTRLDMPSQVPRYVHSPRGMLPSPEHLPTPPPSSLSTRATRPAPDDLSHDISSERGRGPVSSLPPLPGQAALLTGINQHLQ